MNIFGGTFSAALLRHHFCEIHESWSIFSRSALLICCAKQNRFFLKKGSKSAKKTFNLHFEITKNEHDNADEAEARAGCQNRQIKQRTRLRRIWRRKNQSWIIGDSGGFAIYI